MKIDMRYCLFLICICIAACTSDGGSASSSSTQSATNGAASAFPATDPPEALLNAGCSWLLVSDPDLLNIAFPDEAATYWVGVLPYIPDTRVRIDGQFPRARYFSFTAYGPLLSSVDGLADYKLLPRVPGTNPYHDSGVAYGGKYVAYVVPEHKPENPEPNTLYSGDAPIGLGISLPVNPLMLVIYRLYLPELDATGGTPLPVLTLETADGKTALLKFNLGVCTPLPPTGLIPGILNNAIRDSSLPAPLVPLVSTVPLPFTSQDPQFVRNYGVPETVRQSLSTALGIDIPLAPITTSITLNLLPNPDNAYLTALLSRDKESMYVIRGKAPSYAVDPSEAPLGDKQLRYWSICTNELITQRFVDCAADRDVPLDSLGYFTVVVSDPDNRPANALPENGIGWLSWGAIYPDSEVIYRHMLPSPSFHEAVQNIPYGTPAADVMGEYFPHVRYCDRATVESAGANPEAVFAACSAK